MNDAFHAHLDICEQCANNPMDLCPIGASLLVFAAQHVAQSYADGYGRTWTVCAACKGSGDDGECIGCGGEGVVMSLPHEYAPTQGEVPPGRWATIAEVMRGPVWNYGNDLWYDEEHDVWLERKASRRRRQVVMMLDRLTRKREYYGKPYIQVLS